MTSKIKVPSCLASGNDSCPSFQVTTFLHPHVAKPVSRSYHVSLFLTNPFLGAPSPKHNPFSKHPPEHQDVSKGLWRRRCFSGQQAPEQSSTPAEERCTCMLLEKCLCSFICCLYMHGCFHHSRGATADPCSHVGQTVKMNIKEAVFPVVLLRRQLSN